MRWFRHRTLCHPLTLLVLVPLFAGCQDRNPSQPVSVPPGIVPDFKILDVNPNSATYGDSISPRDYLGKISCWYFGHAG